MSEALEIEIGLRDFSAQWRSHGSELEAYANLFFGQFVVLMADETKAGVSGCSTDASVHLIKKMEQQFQVDFFDRNTLAFVVKDKVQLLPLPQLAYAFKNSFIREDTLYFNNLVATKNDLENRWIIPVRDSWLSSRLPLKTNGL